MYARNFQESSYDGVTIVPGVLSASMTSPTGSFRTTNCLHEGASGCMRVRDEKTVPDSDDGMSQKDDYYSSSGDRTKWTK